MTGAYLRVERNGEWLNVEVEHLTKAERDKIIGTRPTEEILRWLDCACNKLAEVQPLLDELEREGLIGRAK